MVVMHVCKKCGLERPEELFCPTHRKRKYWVCKVCNSKITSKKQRILSAEKKKSNNMSYLSKRRWHGL